MTLRPTPPSIQIVGKEASYHEMLVNGQSWTVERTERRRIGWCIANIWRIKRKKKQGKSYLRMCPLWKKLPRRGKLCLPNFGRGDGKAEMDVAHNGWRWWRKTCQALSLIDTFYCTRDTRQLEYMKCQDLSRWLIDMKSWNIFTWKSKICRGRTRGKRRRRWKGWNRFWSLQN